MYGLYAGYGPGAVLRCERCHGHWLSDEAVRGFGYRYRPEAKDYVHAAVFLASDEARFITGDTISPTGGQVYRQDAVLQLGSVSESVTVSAANTLRSGKLVTALTRTSGKLSTTFTLP